MLGMSVTCWTLCQALRKADILGMWIGSACTTNYSSNLLLTIHRKPDSLRYLQQTHCALDFIFLKRILRYNLPIWSIEFGKFYVFNIFGFIAYGSSSCGLNVGYKQERQKKTLEHKFLTPYLKSTATSPTFKCLGSERGTPSEISFPKGEGKSYVVYTYMPRILN